jgi:hypothetical protein
MKVQARVLADIREIAPDRYVIQDGYTTGGYRVRWSIDSYSQALLYYNSINTGNGYKKRLVDASTGEILERYIS